MPLATYTKRLPTVQAIQWDGSNGNAVKTALGINEPFTLRELFGSQITFGSWFLKNSDGQLEIMSNTEFNSFYTSGGTVDLSVVWPIGSIYMTVLPTDPAVLLGFGVWEAFGQGKVLIGVDPLDPQFDTPLNTGGTKTAAAAGSISQPTFTGSPLGTHVHGVGTIAPSAHAGAAVADHASHTHTYTQVPNHTHPMNVQGGTTAATTGTHCMTSTATGGSARAIAAGDAIQNPTGGVSSGTTAGPSATLSHGVTQPADHTMSGSVAAISAGTPAGIVSTPTFTGSPTSVVQPYVVVYMWKRTA